MLQKYKHILGYALMCTSIILLGGLIIYHKELYDYWMNAHTTDLKKAFTTEFTLHNFGITLITWSVAMIPGGLFLGRHLIRNSDHPWIF